MKTLIQQMQIYHAYHQKTATKATHFVGVPLAMFSALMLLAWLRLDLGGHVEISLAWLLAIGTLIYYFFLDVKLALGMLLIVLPMTWLANWLAGPMLTWHGFLVFLVIFVIAWAIQLIGHVFEGRRPALTDNFFQVLIAPIFILAEACFLFGYRLDLHSQLAKNEPT